MGCIIQYPPIIMVEVDCRSALAQVDSGTLSYASFSVPVETRDDPLQDVITYEIEEAGDVLLFLRITCAKLKALELSVFDVTLHSAYFIEPMIPSIYDIRIPMCMLNINPTAVKLIIARAQGTDTDRAINVLATYVVTHRDERLSLVQRLPDGINSSNMLDIALDNGRTVAHGLFKQDAVL